MAANPNHEVYSPNKPVRMRYAAFGSTDRADDAMTRVEEKRFGAINDGYVRKFVTLADEPNQVVANDTVVNNIRAVLHDANILAEYGNTEGTQIAFLTRYVNSWIHRNRNQVPVDVLPEVTEQELFERMTLTWPNPNGDHEEQREFFAIIHLGHCRVDVCKITDMIRYARPAVNINMSADLFSNLSNSASLLGDAARRTETGIKHCCVAIVTSLVFGTDGNKESWKKSILERARTDRRLTDGNGLDLVCKLGFFRMYQFLNPTWCQCPLGDRGPKYSLSSLLKLKPHSTLTDINQRGIKFGVWHEDYVSAQTSAGTNVRTQQETMTSGVHVVIWGILVRVLKWWGEPSRHYRYILPEHQHLLDPDIPLDGVGGALPKIWEEDV